MSEWWTYRLSDFLLFAPTTYQRLFELYHDATWPALVVATLGSFALLALTLAGRARAAVALLAAAWLWIAWAFHWQRFATINWAAVYYAAAFAMQGLLLAWTAWRARWPRPARGGLRRHGGVALLLVAVVAVPLLAPLSGRPWLQAEVVGMAPDPTALATLGVLLAADRLDWRLATIPLLWCLVTAATLWSMDAPQAWLPVVAGAVAVALAVTGRSALSPKR